ncbi:hypothetical protein COP2_039986 [Malus domestica]
MHSGHAPTHVVSSAEFATEVMRTRELFSPTGLKPQSTSCLFFQIFLGLSYNLFSYNLFPNIKMKRNIVIFQIVNDERDK